jgi:hypothetical protein
VDDISVEREATTMNRPKILRPEESYTFAEYFELAYDIEANH